MTPPDPTRRQLLTVAAVGVAAGAMQRHADDQRRGAHDARNLAVVVAFKVSQRKHLRGGCSQPGYRCPNQISQLAIFMSRFWISG